MLGSNFSSSADEPQIPHGEILNPFFSTQLKNQVNDLCIIPPFSPSPHRKDHFYTSNQALILKGEFSTSIQLHFPFCRVSACTALTVLLTEHVTPRYFVTSSLLDGRPVSDPVLPFQLCSEEHIPRISSVPLRHQHCRKHF